MFDNTTHGDDDLFTDTDSDDADVANAADTKENTPPRGDDSAADEQKQDNLNLGDKADDQDKSFKAEEVKRKQVDAWEAKIKSGKVTIDELPANLHWLKPDLEKRIGKQQEVKQPSEADIEALVEKKLTEKTQEKQFSGLVDTLNDLSLEKAKKELLESKYKSLRQRGLSKLDALETAMEIAGVDIEEQANETTRRRMRLPTPGKKLSSGEVDIDSMDYSEAVKTIPVEKRIEHLRKLTERGSH